MFPILQGMRNKICQNNSADFVYEYQELIQCFLQITSWSVLGFLHISIREKSIHIKEGAIMFVRVEANLEQIHHDFSFCSMLAEICYFET